MLGPKLSDGQLDNFVVGVSTCKRGFCDRAITVRLGASALELGCLYPCNCLVIRVELGY